MVQFLNHCIRISTQLTATKYFTPVRIYLAPRSQTSKSICHCPHINHYKSRRQLNATCNYNTICTGHFRALKDYTLRFHYDMQFCNNKNKLPPTPTSKGDKIYHNNSLISFSQAILTFI